jgi:hypothetical protein
MMLERNQIILKWVYVKVVEPYKFLDMKLSNDLSAKTFIYCICSIRKPQSSCESPAEQTDNCNADTVVFEGLLLSDDSAGINTKHRRSHHCPIFHPWSGCHALSVTTPGLRRYRQVF